MSRGRSCHAGKKRSGSLDPSISENCPRSFWHHGLLRALRRLRLEPAENRILPDVGGSLLQWQLASGLLAEHMQRSRNSTGTLLPPPRHF